MRNKVFLLLIPFVFITALMFTACGEGETILITKNQCTITFYALGAVETPSEITVPRGGTMGDKYPDPDPVNEDPDFMFFGWWDKGIEYGADTKINSDLDLVARWGREKEDTFTVKFNSDGGSPVDDLKVLKNKPIGLRLPVSRKANYQFLGWFSGVTQYTAAAPNVTTDNLQLTAQWQLKPTHIVKFNTRDFIANPSLSDVPAPEWWDSQQNCAITQITVYEGEGVYDKLPGVTDTAHPVTHNDSRISFVQWIGPENELYDEFTPINEDMTFYAKWGLPPHVVDMNKTILNGESSVQVAPLYYTSTDTERHPHGGYIKNSIMYDGSGSRWQIMYRIPLDLDASINMGYYSRYNVRARFYGNRRAILGDPLYSSGYMDAANAIKNVGDLMPPKAGFGQLSWCMTTTSNGNPGNDKPGVIAQQYNLGTASTINAKWLIGGDYDPADGNKTAPPKYLLIQTSDNWIGWIEVYEIIFHNGEQDFLDPPATD